MAHVVLCLICKCEALSSNLNPTKERKKDKNEASRDVYNPTYLGGGDQEDGSSRSAHHKGSETPISNLNQ
jgi:hypothetical protein